MRLYLVTLLLFQRIVGLILKSDAFVQPNDLLLFDSFGFLSGGKYTFNIFSQTVTSHPGILLLIVDIGKNCDVIGKACTYKLFKIQNICKALTSQGLNESVEAVFPAIMPSEYYTTLNTTNTLDLNISEWNNYAEMNIWPLGDFIDGKLAPAIQKQFPPGILVNDTQNSSSTNEYIKYANNHFTGIINTSSLYYFSILSCSNDSYQYFIMNFYFFRLTVNYEFINPDDENLSVTQLPYKVFTALYNLVHSYYLLFYLGSLNFNWICDFADRTHYQREI